MRQADYYVENPLAPHRTTGQIARVGTAVGYLYNERLDDVFAMGLTAAAGHRWGRLALEAEYTYLQYQVAGPSTVRLGHGNRLGAIARFDVLRLDSTIVGDNSLFAIYVEGGAGVAWNSWYTPGNSEPMRIVPSDSKRVEALTGFGIMIDHRLQEPIGFPHRIAWFLGWRVGMSPHEAEPASICRGVECRPAPAMPQDRFVDRSMLFQSSLMFTW
ncbi:MAG: hypothetical protein KF773_00750 [Deltaproteobacteria bacterium]|nr:hypothetical protein [Deltaproteobacteria bacterium]